MRILQAGLAFLFIFLSIPTIASDTDGDGFSDLQETYEGNPFDSRVFPTFTATIPIYENRDDASENVNGDMGLWANWIAVSGNTKPYKGFRFSVPVPYGYRVTEAYIQFKEKGTEDSASGHPNVEIYIENSTDAYQFSDSVQFDLSSRPMFSQKVDWNDIPLWANSEISTDSATPDLSNLMNLVISQPGWLEGNHIVFKFVSGIEERKAVSYDSDPNDAAKLIISYSPIPEYLVDSDGDGLEDYIDQDDDNDGLTDDEELFIGTNHQLDDTDGDGVKDFLEFSLGSDPVTEFNQFREIIGNYRQAFYLYLVPIF